MKKKLFLVISLILLSIPLWARQIKVLPLDIYSPNVSRPQAENILKAIIQRLKKYKKYKIMTPPGENPLDMILDAGFMDLNAKSLAGLGKARGADVVVYTEVKKEGHKVYINIRKVDVATQKWVAARGNAVSIKHPESGVIVAINRVFGPIPKPPPAKSTVTITTIPPAAEVYVEGNFLGKSPIVTKMKPGHYKMKIVKAGYKDVTKSFVVKRGQVSSIKLSLQQILIPKPVVPPGQQRKRVEQGKKFYQTWWFWTAVGVVVVGGVATGVILGTRSTSGPTGSSYFGMDPGKAYLDPAVQGK